MAAAEQGQPCPAPKGSLRWNEPIAALAPKVEKLQEEINTVLDDLVESIVRVMTDAAPQSKPSQGDARRAAQPREDENAGTHARAYAGKGGASKPRYFYHAIAEAA
jgi:hypothetical protein